ncbi:diacylglycerol kinase family protein [Methylopila sp. M107]|uniref:diacylglycerol/lipid kinase family protein n=1 Tax=Methylopila sp. M107 TaxID=1101190 RepID=UPI00058D9A4E|nr:diacylglycerol kinase family protein [Methylopila sp. M107]
MAKCLVLLNPRAGTLKDLKEEAGSKDPGQLVDEAFARAGKEVDVRMVPPRDLGSALDELGKGDDHEEIIVGGGDGSLSRSLGRLLATGKIFGVLPFGTMNLLARDLGVPNDDMDEAIRALSTAEPARIDLASINGRPFHSISGLGFFAQMARAREAARGLKGFGRYAAFGYAAFRAFFRSGRSRYQLVIDGAPVKVEATAVLITNNAFGDESWRRERLDRGEIEVIVAHAGGWRDRFRLGAQVLRGGWRTNPLIEIFEAKSAVVEKSRRTRVWVATDGELTREQCPLVYESMPGAALMLRPVPAASDSAEAPAA